MPIDCKNSRSEVSDEILNSLELSLDAIFAKYKQNVREKPEEYVDAMKAFITQNDKLSHSETGLLSALHSFGKQSGPAPLAFTKKRGGSVIPVQPTSKARRTVYIGGKRAQFTGRPPKAMMNSQALDPEHNYGQPPKKRALPSSDPVWNQLPKRGKAAAPHALQHCVMNNQMVGSSHSRK